MRGLLVAAATAVLLILAPAARSGGPGLIVGAAEDDVKANTLVQAQAKLDLLKLGGLDAVRVTSIWDPADPDPSTDELTKLQNLASAARVDGIDVFVSVYNAGSRTTPLSDADRGELRPSTPRPSPAVLDVQNFVIGNEPNLNRFWLPQFDPDGSDAAAPAYLRLLARTYTALKAVDSTIKVFGGAVSPRGIDRPGTGRDTHSPGTFIKDMGAAYKASGLTGPVMDALVFHPYPRTRASRRLMAHLTRRRRSAPTTRSW